MSANMLKEMVPFVEKNWGKTKGKEIINDATLRWKELCEANKEEPKAKKTHLVNKIFPCISLYETLQKEGVSKEEALKFLDQSWSKQAEPGAAKMGKMLKPFGLYKLYPAIFTFVAKKQYGDKAGFKAKFYSLGKGHSKFDMTKCIYKDTCEKYGYPELTQCFCHVDDVNNEGLHPNLCWNRTKFMGNGDDICDFDIFVTKK